MTDGTPVQQLAEVLSEIHQQHPRAKISDYEIESIEVQDEDGTLGFVVFDKGKAVWEPEKNA